MASLRGLECVPANDTRASAAAGRRAARYLPGMLAETDWAIGGFSYVRAAPDGATANLTLDDLAELVLVQRDWGIDAGLRSTDPEQITALRLRAASACAAVYSWLGLADFDDDHVLAAATGAGGPEELALTVLSASRTIGQQAITGLDVASVLDEFGFDAEAETLLALIRARLGGGQLQPAAYFDETLACRSQISEPNDYTGPGTGPARPCPRREELTTVPGQLSIADVRAAQDRESIPGVIDVLGPAAALDDPRDVVVAVSPAFGRGIWATLSGLSVIDVLDEVLSGLEEEGCSGRVVRVTASADLGRISAAGAALAGSGVAVGLEGQGGVVIVRRSAVGPTRLDEISSGTAISARSYRQVGVCAARHAKAALPPPLRSRHQDPALAGSQMRAVSYAALESEQRVPGARPEHLEVPRD